VPAAENAFADCDVLLAIGTRFGEIATGSFGLKPTWKLIHADINPEVFNANYPAQVTIEGDARATLQALLAQLPPTVPGAEARRTAVSAQLAKDKAAYEAEWRAHDSGERVNPGRFLKALREHLPDDAYLVTDDGNHTFLVAELFGSRMSRHLITPTDFNCMGYGVPASIGIKLTHPKQDVVAVVGDGAFLMTGLELLTATQHGLGVVVYVFNDGELSQISQAQSLPYNRKTCTVLPTALNIKGVADAVSAGYVCIEGRDDVAQRIAEAHRLAAQGRPVVVDVRVDYSKPTRFSKGIMQTNFGRLGLGDKARMVGRAVWRKVAG
jgi:acetolactate synthase-1/2/3 large subunit